MKMHVLTAAVLAALASGSVLAASEGGDTWSTVQPVQQSTYSALPSASRLDVAFQGSEGGDTWSSVQAVQHSTYQAASSASRLDVAFQASEGGDTWSSVQPLPRSFAPSGSRAVVSVLR
jgi:hypothetical protein